MKLLSPHFVIVAATLACTLSHAQSVEVKDAWIRGTVPAQKATGAFMDITAKNNARLISVESKIAASTDRKSVV